jgi:predicted nucleic-acid-binding protein
MVQCRLFVDYADLRRRSPATRYAYTRFPELRYRQPDLDQWLAALKPDAPAEDEFVEVFREAGRVRFIRVLAGGNNRVHEVAGDVIQFVDPNDDDGRLFITQVAVCRWVYVYQHDRLARHETYQRGIPPLADEIYAIHTYEYWAADLATPRSTFTFKDRASHQRGVWCERSDHNRRGEIVNTVYRQGE